VAEPGQTCLVLQPDIATLRRGHGNKRMAEMAHACGVGYAHIGMSGIVCETASIHVASAMPNLRIDGMPQRFKPVQNRIGRP